MHDGHIIGIFMKELLQKKCNCVGIKIVKMELMEVQYHAEVAQSLLQIQQAQAKMDARKLIVEGSVMIVNDALQRLNENGIHLERDKRNDLVKKLMVVTCSDQGHAHPVLNIWIKY